MARNIKYVGSQKDPKEFLLQNPDQLMIGLPEHDGKKKPDPNFDLRPENVTEQGDVADAQQNQEALDAKEIIADVLSSYGLESLVDEAWEMLIEMDSPNPETVVLQLRRTEEFQDRFKGMALRTAAGHAAISPAEYIALERSYKDAMMTAGIPESFYDSPDDLAEFIGNDVSQAEFTARVGMAAEAVRSVDPNLKVQLQEMYGVGVENDGELIAYFLDPERGVNVIEQRLQLEAAGLSAASLGTLGSGLTAPTAERLADMAVQTREITQRFAGQRAITQQLVGEESAMTADEFAAASFGLDSEATSDLARLRAQREQRGRRQSGAAMTQTGVTGLGRAK